MTSAHLGEYEAFPGGGTRPTGRKVKPRTHALLANSSEAGPVAYAPTMAAALSGAMVAQLRHWRSPRTGPLLAPEISAESRIIYSFRDLLALRIFVHLRQNASLHRIRKAVGSLRDLGEIQDLASYQLVSDDTGNIRLITGGDEIELARHPGQMLLAAMA
jgi:DNA-binding transcriptional MerR regulator